MHHLPRRGLFLALALGTSWVGGCAVDASPTDAAIEEPSHDGGTAADVEAADASFIDGEPQDAKLADAEPQDAELADAEAWDAAHDDGSCDPLAMPTPNAGLAEAPGEAGCPSGMLRIETFCVDRFEASLVEITAGGEQPWSPYFNPGTRRVRAVSLGGAVPQGYITADQAEAACAEAGKRLCTNTEWLRACQGPQVLTYPYGAQRQAGVCNDARALHPAIELFGTSEPWIWSELDHPCLNQLPDSLALTGAHPGCVTAEGLFDMMGNLHEWTSDPAGTFRGGFYVDTVANGPGCLYATTAHNRLHWDYSTGFRCCAPAP